MKRAPAARLGPAAPSATPARTPPTPSAPGAIEPIPEPTTAAPRARVAIVIDDLGRERQPVEALLALGMPLSYAILPFEPRTGEVAELLRGRGAELLVHLPMEPAGEADPGPGALSEEMSARQVADATRAALAAVPDAVGVNNHMGSAVTADRSTMRALLAVLGEKDLFFLDSRTSAESVGYELAREAGVPAARRDLFLDESDDRAAIVAAIDRLVELARAEGAAIGIAHPRPETLAAFADRLPLLAAEGVELVPVSFLVERSEELPE